MTLIARLIAPVAAIALGLAEGATAQTIPPQAAPVPAPPAITYQPVGTWSGTSACTEQAVLCEDEEIVIHVSPDAKPKFYDVDFATVRNGMEIPENHLVMSFSDDHHVLRASFVDERKRLNTYFLAVKNDKIHGILLIDGRLLERGVDLKRTDGSGPPALSSGVTASSSAAASTQ